MGREGFEPSKPKQQIYSLPPLTAREPLQNRVAYSGSEKPDCQSQFFGKIGKIDYHLDVLAGVAQSVEQLPCKQWVGGSIPFASSKI